MIEAAPDRPSAKASKTRTARERRSRMGALDNFGVKPDEERPELTPKPATTTLIPVVAGGSYEFGEEIMLVHPNPAAANECGNALEG
jgi:hypothetical protein